MQSTFRRMIPKDEYFFREGCYILELSNSADDPDVSIVRARVTPGMTTRRHRLHGITERYVIIEGMGRVDVDGQEESVGFGDVVIIPPRSSQRITNTGNGDLVFLAVCTPRFIYDAYEDLDDESVRP
jgi:mannose-6-phosphate isomerase-like protein (cupin superfamily)